MKGHIEIVELFIRIYSDGSTGGSPDNFGMYPIDYARLNKQHLVVEFISLFL